MLRGWVLLLCLATGCVKGMSPGASHKARSTASDVLRCPRGRIDLTVDTRSDRTGKAIALFADGCGRHVWLIRLSGQEHWFAPSMQPAMVPEHADDDAGAEAPAEGDGQETSAGR